MINRRSLLLAAPALLLPRSAGADFVSNGTNQRLVDWSQRPMVRDSGDVTTVAGRTQVLAASLPNGTVQIIFDGQSTNSNGVNGASGLSLTNIYNMSITTRGVIFNALEPLMSCDISQFHHGINLARSIIDNGFAGTDGRSPRCRRTPAPSRRGTQSFRRPSRRQRTIAHG